MLNRKILYFLFQEDFFRNNVKFVAMFQNMQIFETLEKNREGLSIQWLQYIFKNSSKSDFPE